ncbi:carboxypeptidase regulatory-like domain-containing protein [Haladaptatus sp. GCM10025707]|uniref:DUF7382 domain-containing protein n=1 Tax=unclassified Haladaptatus TaxID=2622732 RepID=UPI0023E7D315|nr:MULTISPECIES: carboxypeptidase regulatory-like domain-containing protein [unclassified Haladaptatus]
MSAFSRLLADDRAIESLPIRLVIALVVGVASLSVMMNMLSGVQGLAVSELDVRPQPAVINPGSEDVTLEVVDADGNSVSNATVVVRGGTADLERIHTARTNGDGEATASLSPSLAPNRDMGTLELSVKPPAGSSFVDRRENTELLVVRD